MQYKQITEPESQTFFVRISKPSTEVKPSITCQSRNKVAKFMINITNKTIRCHILFMLFPLSGIYSVKRLNMWSGIDLTFFLNFLDFAKRMEYCASVRRLRNRYCFFASVSATCIFLLFGTSNFDHRDCIPEAFFHPILLTLSGKTKLFYHTFLLLSRGNWFFCLVFIARGGKNGNSCPGLGAFFA